MRPSLIFIASVVTSRVAADDITESFYLTFVSSTGDEYAAIISRDSSQIDTLSAGSKYINTFILNVDTMRIGNSENPLAGNGNLRSGEPVIFTSAEVTDATLFHTEGPNGAGYLVKKGANNTLGWWSEPIVGDSIQPVYWKGTGAGEANMRLRIDKEKPDGR